MSLCRRSRLSAQQQEATPYLRAILINRCIQNTITVIQDAVPEELPATAGTRAGFRAQAWHGSENPSVYADRPADLQSKLISSSNLLQRLKTDSTRHYNGFGFTKVVRVQVAEVWVLLSLYEKGWQSCAGSRYRYVHRKSSTSKKVHTIACASDPGGRGRDCLSSVNPVQTNQVCIAYSQFNYARAIRSTKPRYVPATTDHRYVMVLQTRGRSDACSVACWPSCLLGQAQTWAMLPG